MSSEERIVDFEVVSEPWNKYEVSDNTIIKTKYIITKILRTTKDGKQAYQIEGQTTSVVLNVSCEKGPKDPQTYPVEVLRSSIKNDNMTYKTVAEEWNEYRVEDLTRIRLKTTITKVAKTSKFDMNGDPVYLIDNNVILQIIPPNKIQ